MLKSVVNCYVVLASLASVAGGVVISGRVSESVSFVRDLDNKVFTVQGVGSIPHFKDFGEGLFYREMNDYYIEDGITEVGAYAFGHGITSEMETVWMANSVTSVCQYAFYGQQNFRSARLSSSLETIGDYAFARTGLTTIEIPASVKRLGSCAFGNCDSLKSVTFRGSEPPAVPNPGDLGGLDASVQVYIQPGVDPAPFRAMGFQRINEAAVVLVRDQQDLEDAIARAKTGECVIARLDEYCSCSDLEVPKSVSLTLDLSGNIITCKKLKVLGSLNLVDASAGKGFIRPESTLIGRQGSIMIGYGPIRTMFTYNSQGLMLLFK